MPILAGGVKVTPPVKAPPVVVTPPDIPNAWWVDPTGRQWSLMDTSQGWWLTDAGIAGLDAAVDTVFTTSPVARGGQSVDWIQDDARTITLPFRVEGSSHDEYTATRRTFTGMWTCTKRLRKPGTLVVARPDGTRRAIKAMYQSGIAESGGKATMIRKDFVSVSLFCENPYWYDLDSITIKSEEGATQSFYSPYPRISSSQRLGSRTVHIPGDAKVWPTWVFTGPMSQATAVNATTGKTFVMDPTAVAGAALAAGETLTITGDPVEFTGPGTGDWETSIDWDSYDLWPLLPGDNDVSFEASGAGAGTSVSVTFNVRYETA